jgi:hypothetical protein
MQTSETALELLNELRTAFLLVGTILREVPSPSATQMLLKKGETIGFIEVRDESDKRFLGVFTDHPELWRFTDKSNSTQVMPTRQAMSHVVDYEYDGLVLNPAGDASLRLDAAFIRNVIDKM